MQPGLPEVIPPGSKNGMDIRFDDTPGGSQIAIALTTEELAALARGTITVTLPEGTAGTSGIAQVVLSGPAGSPAS